MSECFLKKYSPKNINDFFVDDIKSIDKPLTHNIIICGNSGTGKTSLILKLISIYFNYSNNSNIYNDDNVLFMNNLKDQGIQYCRSNVKLFCQTKSSNSEIDKKIIAIDDIDTFSEVSQQVISNYINTYSNNIIFLATCTNFLKVYNGLKSRTITINMLNATNKILSDLCEKVIQNEKIIINKKYIPIIVDCSNSSYKILLNALLKIKMFDDIIDDNTIYEIVTSINNKNFERYIAYIKNKDINNSIKIIYEMASSGISVIDILYELTVYIKNVNNHLNDIDKYEIVTLISKYITIFHEVHEDVIELVFLTNDLVSKLSNT
tara:strand:- start:15891 stop:16853 length:963 start_codon:yes stop_codon:yes gene_type:complete